VAGPRPRRFDLLHAHGPGGVAHPEEAGEQRGNDHPGRGEQERREPVGQRARQRTHGCGVREHERGEQPEHDETRAREVARLPADLRPVLQDSQPGLVVEERAQLASELLDQLRQRMPGVFPRDGGVSRFGRLCHRYRRRV